MYFRNRKMNNQHLIPANVIDIVDKLSKQINENEKANYLYRLEAIREYCDANIKKFGNVTFFDKVKKK